MKFLKRISVLFAALLLALGAAALAACGETPSPSLKDPVTYTVTVVYEDGSPVEGAKVMLGENGPYLTDANGAAKAELESGTYAVEVTGLPAGYTAQAATITAKLPRMTVQVIEEAKNEAVLFTVKVVYPNGDPVEGAKIGMCKGDRCNDFGTTDAQGTVSQKLMPAAYTVQIVAGLPAGYTYEKDGGNHYMKDGQVVSVTEEDPNVTVTLKAE